MATSQTVQDVVDRSKRRLVAFGDWPHGVIELGVVICIVIGIAILPGALRDALDGNDSWADRNGSLAYMNRQVPREDAVGSQRVVEDARLWMPEDAKYRIVQAADLSGPLQWAAPDFLAAFLLPRRETASGDAEWVFCYRCDPSSLGDGFEVLSESGDGILFGRMSR